MSSRSSPMVSLSKSIQQVTNREAVGVLQGQRLANSQYDDNSTLAFSFPEETDSPWQLRPKMFAYFCSNKFFSGFKREYIPQICSVASPCVFAFTYTAHPRKIFFHFVLQTSSEVRPCSQPVGVADAFKWHMVCLLVVR